MPALGLYYSKESERSNPPETEMPPRVYTTGRQVDNPFIYIIAPGGIEIAMDRTEAVVTYLALGVALKTTEGRLDHD